MVFLIRKFILLQYFITIIFGESMSLNDNKESMKEKGTFGAGCFWCVEAIFERLDGVLDVSSGYSGGQIDNPTYDEVCTGKTGHAEVVQITFNPKIISYEELLRFFWDSHDPTTENRQGADIGTQYRSVIFYHTEEQRELAENFKSLLELKKIYNDPIVTEISPLINYHMAEKYHQNYYKLNPDAPYCQMVIRPKLKKVLNK